MLIVKTTVANSSILTILYFAVPISSETISEFLYAIYIVFNSGIIFSNYVASLHMWHDSPISYNQMLSHSSDLLEKTLSA